MESYSIFTTFLYSSRVSSFSRKCIILKPFPGFHKRDRLRPSCLQCREILTPHFALTSLWLAMPRTIQGVRYLCSRCKIFKVQDSQEQFLLQLKYSRAQNTSTMLNSASFSVYHILYYHAPSVGNEEGGGAKSHTDFWETLSSPLGALSAAK